MTDAFDLLPAIVLFLDAEGRVVGWNRSATLCLGLRGEDLLQRGFFDLFQPLAPSREGSSGTSRVFLPSTFQGLVASGSGGTLEVAWRSAPAGPPWPEGTLCLVGVEVAAIAPPLIEGVEREEWYQALFTSTLDCVFVHDLQGRFLDANDAALRLLGYARGEIPALGLADLLPAEQLPLANEVMREVLQLGSQSRPREFSLVSADGSLIEVEARSSVIRREGRPVAILGIARDISERKLFERALVRSETRYRSIFESATDAILVLDAESGAIVDVNPALERLLAQDEDDLVGHLLWELPAFARTRVTQEAVVSVRQLGTLHLPEELVLGRDGRRIVAEIQFHAYLVEDAPVIQCQIRDVSVRKQALEALQESERFLATVVDNIPGLMFVKEAQDLHIVRVNPAGERMIGRTLKEVVGQTVDDLFSPEQAQAITRRDREALARREPVDSPEELIQSRTRGPALLRTRRIPILAEDGSPQYLLTLAEDITRRRAAEDELLRHRDHLEELVLQRTTQLADAMDRAKIVEWSYDPSSGSFSFNSRFYALHGTTVEQEQGWQMPAWTYCSAFLHPDDVDAFVHAIDQALKSKTPDFQSQFEHRIVRRDGEQRHLVVHLGVVNDEAGQPSELRGTSQDITERRRVEEELRILAAAIDQSPVAVVVTDLDARIRYVNPWFIQVTGFARDEVIGKNPRMFKSGVHPPEFYAELWQSLAQGRSWRGEFCNRKKSGELYWEEAVITPVRNERGQITHFVDVWEDTTERRRVAGELREAKDGADAANQAKGEFLARMSHEIRTPMNAVVGMTHLLLQTALTPLQASYARNVQIASQRLIDLINDVLDFSKIEAGRLELECIAFDLDEVLEEVSSLVGLGAAQKGLELVVHRERSVPVPLMGDPLRLGQILLNLLSNALKFTTRGEVVLHVGVADSAEGSTRLAFTVRDTGIGMTEDEQGRLFRAFSQADGSTSRRFGGTGLGLAICRRLADLMNGEIQVQSEAGRGSAFRFTAPFALQPDESRCRPGVPEDMAGRRILVVDDNAEYLSATVSMLQEASFFARGFASVEAARGALEQEQEAAFELVLLDWQSPAGQNRHALEALRAAPALNRAVAVALAPSTVADDATAALEDGLLAEVLLKPCTPTSLFEGVLSAMGRERRGTRGRRAAPRRLVEAGAQLRRARVLVVEDDEINRQVALRLLQRAGVEVVLAADGAEGIAQVLASVTGPRFSAVLMDLRMPVLDGWQATQAIKADPRFAELPIIALTADAVEGVRESCLEAGMCDLVTKPFDPALLLATIARWIQHHEQALSERAEDPPQGSIGPARDGGDAPHPAFDRTLGLSRVGGDPDLYAQILGSFAERYADAAWRVSTLCSQGRWEEGIRLAHTVQGLAGTLGAQELQACAARLVAALRARAGDQAKEQAAFATALDLALRELPDLPHAAARPGPGPADPDPFAAKKQLGGLRVLIEQHDIEALGRATLVQGLLRGGPVEALIQSVVDRLAAFDFQRAKVELDELAQHLTGEEPLPSEIQR